MHEENGAIFLHPFDDPYLIAGYGSLGADILEDILRTENVPPDIVLVCCGGGGLLAGVASYIYTKTSGNTHVYGVEPESANGMYQSMKVILYTLINWHILLILRKSKVYFFIFIFEN